MAQSLLQNKNILIGVTASIAIYKTCELIRLFVKAGANVRVVISEDAKKFIAPLTFEALTNQKVLDITSEDWSSDYNHIAIGKWADLFIIAPATANTINKLSNGIADNLITQIALAYPRIKLIAPSANTNMINNPITQASLKMLKLCNYEVIKTEIKELACKDVGDGAMAEPKNIFDIAVSKILEDEYWKNRKVVVSCGGTIEKIDDIRYISNFSSGKMGVAIATSLYYKGADVCLIKTLGVNEIIPNGIHTITVQSTNEMYEYIKESISVAKKGVLTKSTIMDNSKQELIQKKPYFFSVAAVSDFVPSYPQHGKIKKDDIGENWNLNLSKNIDILSSIDKDGIYTIGFKAEMDITNAKNNAQNMLKNKNLDGVCLNILQGTKSFGTKSNTIELILKNSEFFFDGDKLDISFEIIETLAKEFHD
ncbi:bifunctional phosphopantothenoylcysteine decarboxylase/phosphopantothenate--cysteine ligase CoaBC [Arcobacter sp. FWKO B]|uniref:bifunctional phosphopantothenoylcysteine decarboxylase/phosphopantothenate--cysteine ligase CoaBC n=1 Tax=Arcobacter sp. FWKO B TaxID=2593672 RepID=UPI0018A435A3|nr:bifunctional phosphopantothenoylcysteine decarboxylase/phosphopantothenate--cysteine ligase CoaBC [Arcobacter sp. FWKO B]QOG12188.1 bifunctional phosphopantothenoylcysteine decarboxylase/phosphopantothenate--cysteine ligase CoaBC [Arcobacter sp. FWKO B]